MAKEVTDNHSISISNCELETHSKSGWYCYAVGLSEKQLDAFGVMR